MVSEAKKPLVLSMAFLAVFSIIVLSVSTYMVINNMKSTRPVPPIAASISGVGTGKKETFKGAVKKVMIINRFRSGSNQETVEPSADVKRYCDDLDLLDEGNYPFSVMNSEDSDGDESFECDNELLDGIMQVEEIVADIDTDTLEPESTCKIFDLKDSFGISGSNGKFGWFSRNPKEIEIFTNLKDFLSDSGSKIYSDKIIYFDGKPCHVIVVISNDEDVDDSNDEELEINDDTLLVLIDHLLTQSEPWPIETLNSLNVPNVFGLFAVLSPEDSLTLNNTFRIENINKNPVIISDAIYAKQAIFYGNLRVAVFRDHLKSLTNYSAYMKINGLDFIGNDTFTSETGHITIHYAADNSSNLDVIRSNLEIIVVAVLEKAKRISNEEEEETVENIKYFGDNSEMDQLVFSDKVAFLIVFPDTTIDYDVLGPCQVEELISNHERTVPGYFSNAISVTKVFKISNYKIVQGQEAHRLLFKCNDSRGLVPSRIIEIGEYSIEIRGVSNDQINQRIAQAAVNLISGDFAVESLARRWDQLISVIHPDGPVEVTIWKI